MFAGAAHRLEEALGRSLIDRSQRTAALTAEGEQLLGYARRMLELNDVQEGVLTVAFHVADTEGLLLLDLDDLRSLLTHVAENAARIGRDHGHVAPASVAAIQRALLRLEKQGGKLLFGDGRLQHVGVMIRCASPGHLFRGYSRDYDGYANTVRIANNYSAVTGACLMVRRDVFDEVGGLSSKFPLSFNDIDFCLKVRSRGKRVVYDPDTVLYHFESSSRSPKVSDWELELFQKRWRHATMQDPYDNPNFHPSTLNMMPPIYQHDGGVLV